MILLPPITREEDLLPAIELLVEGEALVVHASFRRPENLSPEIVWSNEIALKGGKNKLRCVRRKSAAETSNVVVGARAHADAYAGSPCPCS